MTVPGNANPYDYCTADAVNCTDTSGMWSTWYLSCGGSWRSHYYGFWTSGYDYHIRCAVGHGYVNSFGFAWLIAGAVIGAVAGFEAGIWGAGIGAFVGAVVGGLTPWWYGTFCRRQDGIYTTGTIYERWPNAFGHRWWDTSFYPGWFWHSCH